MKLVKAGIIKSLHYRSRNICSNIELYYEKATIVEELYHKIAQINNIQYSSPNEKYNTNNFNQTTSDHNIHNITRNLSIISSLSSYKLLRIGNKCNIKTVFKTNNILRTL